MGVYHKTVNDAIAGYRWSGFPEFQGYHAQLHWAHLGSTELPITVTTGTPDLFLRVLTPPLPPTWVSTRASVFPSFPEGNISLPHGIGAIGNKFAEPTEIDIGPSSAPNIATGLYEGETAFYFGALPQPGTDRDDNSLSDSWELHHFKTLGQDPLSDLSGDGWPLLFDNAFGLSPWEYARTSPRFLAFESGADSNAVFSFHVPEQRWNEFRYLPELSEDLQSWFDEETFPEYFQSTSSLLDDERKVFVEPGSGWPSDSHTVFLRLRISRK